MIKLCFFFNPDTDKNIEDSNVVIKMLADVFSFKCKGQNKLMSWSTIETSSHLACI